MLIVDDEVNLRFAIERRLRKSGMETGSASTVRHAIDRLRNEPYDVVLCDLRMPGGNGTQLLQWLGSYSPSTKIIVISAFVTPDFRKTYQPTGRLRILEKPVDLDVLVETLEELGPRKGFYGNAIEVELFDYVQMIALSGRDKLVEVTTPAGKGLIWFEHGDIVHVEYDQYRGEMAFYRLLSVNRGTFKEVFAREPPMRTVVRSSTHLLMEAARQADEGTLGQVPGEVEEDEETSFGSVADELADELPEPVPEPPPLEDMADELAAPFEEPELVKPSESAPARELTFHPGAPAGLPVVDDEDLVDPFAEPDDSTIKTPSTPAVTIPRPPPLPRPKPPPEAEPTVAVTAASSPVAAAESRAAILGLGDAEDGSGAAGMIGPGHALFEDPDMRDVMLEQFWQFEGINGVAIISSTGKVLAEDMRNNSSLVTLAGFYMRGAARIARTLGYNVFDGVVARSVNGQQMVMVSMGAASAVLSVEPGTDPEAVRDAVMGVE